MALTEIAENLRDDAARRTNILRRLALMQPRYLRGLQRFEQLPGPVRDILEQFQDILELLQEIRERFPDIQENFQDMREKFQDIPEAFTGIRKFMRGRQEAMRDFGAALQAAAQDSNTALETSAK